MAYLVFRVASTRLGSIWGTRIRTSGETAHNETGATSSSKGTMKTILLAFCSSFFCYVQAATVECFDILPTFFSLYRASLFDKVYWRVKKGARRSRWARPQAEHVGLKPNEFQHKHVMSTELPPKFPTVLGWDQSSHGDIPPQFHLHVTDRYVTDTKETWKTKHQEFRLIIVHLNTLARFNFSNVTRKVACFKGLLLSTSMSGPPASWADAAVGEEAARCIPWFARNCWSSSQRLFQHTFGTHPSTFTNRIWRDSFHGWLRGLPGVCSMGVL